MEFTIRKATLADALGIAIVSVYTWKTAYSGLLPEEMLDKRLADLPKMAENMKDLNRIKVVLVEKKRTNKWLAEQLGKDPATISKWCTNTSQPDLATLLQVANLLEVDVKDLLNSSREEEFKIVRV